MAPASDFLFGISSLVYSSVLKSKLTTVDEITFVCHWRVSDAVRVTGIQFNAHACTGHTPSHGYFPCVGLQKEVALTF